MKRRVLTFMGVFALLTSSGFAYAAGDAAAGKEKTAACVGCHGANGEGVDQNPALAGRSEEEIVGALKDYRSGKRANPIMKSVASIFNDEDMANIGAYYASLKK